VLEFIRHRIDRDDFRSFTIFHFFELLHQFLAGNWQAIEAMPEDLLEQNLKVGEVYWVSMPLHWHGLHDLYRGELESAHQVVNRLTEIAAIYENEVTRLLKYLLNTNVLLACCRLPEALEEIDRGIDFAERTNTMLALIHLLSARAQAHLLQEDREAAETYLEQALLIRREMDAVPWQLSCYLKTRTALDLYRLREETLDGTKSGRAKFRDKALASCRAFEKQTRKVAQHRTEALRMMGEFGRLTQNSKQAIKWWRKAMQTGQQLGARLELARTHFEVGRHLMAPDLPYSTLDGIDAPAYLKQAREAFEAMGLAWDLDKLSRLDIN
jgi:tetratricopeptide (TPR) repeat protein